MSDRLPYSLIIRQLVALLTGIVIPLAMEVVPGLAVSLLDQIFVGVLAYVTVTVAGLAYDVSRVLDTRARQEPLNRLTDKFALHLHNIYVAFNSLSQQARVETDLFISYFSRMIDSFDDTISQAASKRELVVNELHVPLTDILLRCFTGRETDVARLVHYMNNNDFMMDVWSRGYYTRMVKMVEDNKLREVRRLFVFTDHEQLDDPISKRILDFHVRQPGYDCRVVSDADYKKFLRDAMLDTLDFGVYGDLYVYKTRYATSQRIEGTFSSASNRVEAFTEMFDNCWQHGFRPRPSTSSPMSLFELFEGIKPPEDLTEIVDDGPLPRAVSWRRHEGRGSDEADQTSDR